MEGGWGGEEGNIPNLGGSGSRIGQLWILSIDNLFDTLFVSMHLDDAGWILCRLSENPVQKDIFIVEPVGRSPIMVAKLRLPQISVHDFFR